MKLVDTSVWVRHLREGDHRFVELLNQGEVYCHPLVIGELACGNIRNRDELLGLLTALPSAPLASHDEVLALVIKRRLAGRGLGWIEMHLLASALLAGCTLWTLDKRLATAASDLRLADPDDTPGG